MFEQAAMPFSVSSCRHRALGKQIRLQLMDDFVLKFMPAEASSLSFALAAVRAGISPEREIYLSPIASDMAFAGTVQASGMSIAIPGGTLELNWASVGALIAALAAAIDR